MRGDSRKHEMGLLVAALCAACGCASSKSINTVDGPLTPYSSTASATPATIEPSSASGGSSGPIRYDPASIDPRLLDQKEQAPNWFEKLTEATAPKRVSQKWAEFWGRGPDEAVARHAYNMGDLYFREGNYKEAVKFYKQAAARWPDSPLQEDALFMAGESWFQLNRYPKASDAYSKMVKKYENSRHLDWVIKRRFAIGRYWEQRGKVNPVKFINFKDKTMPGFDPTSNTVAIYESIRMDDPTGPLADDATMASANTYFIHGRWEDAAYHYDLMRTEFPQSEFQPQAHLLGMEAKLRCYQGPHYDVKPLMDAKKLAHTLQTQYAAQLPNERENIQQALKSIDAQLAEREWAMGEFYYGTRHYAAARYYYNAVVKDYPQSRFADLAKTRVEQVKDKPPDPKNEIEWITSKFRRAPPAPAQAPQAPGAAPTAPPTSVPADQPFLAGQPSGAPRASSPPVVAQQPQNQR
jgi:outer membrane protein assembly factor BamD (BamD/ComL family)